MIPYLALHALLTAYEQWDSRQTLEAAKKPDDKRLHEISNVNTGFRGNARLVFTIREPPCLVRRAGSA